MSGPTGFRDPRYAKAVADEIKTRGEGKQLRIIHVCGTHEDTISQHGLRALLPKGISLVAGPGCPVCVCAAEDVDMAIELARQGHIITTFGDMFRVPSTESSLTKEKTKELLNTVIKLSNEAHPDVHQKVLLLSKQYMQDAR